MCIRDRATTKAHALPLRLLQKCLQHRQVVPAHKDRWAVAPTHGDLCGRGAAQSLSLIHISEPTRLALI
eukprot:6499127-Alexandrium_andersonii.AAC.1